MDLIDVRRVERIVVQALEKNQTPEHPPPLPADALPNPAPSSSTPQAATIRQHKEVNLTRNAELTPLLKRLKLSAMMDTLPQRIALALREQLDYSSFLKIILADEISRRENRRIELRLRAAGFEETCRLEDLDWSTSITLYRRLLDAVSSLGFLLKHEHILDDLGLHLLTG